MGVSDIDYGPLAPLIGNWRSDRGMDVSPEPEGTEENPYYETIVFEAAGEVTNAEAQTLAIVRYHQVVSRKSDDEVFHDQIGYWTSDPATRGIAQSITIPRGVAILARGSFEGSPSGPELVLQVSAKRGDPDWRIIESPFMRDKASRLAFEHRLEIGAKSMTCRETTSLSIYGRRFDHTDTKS